MGDEELDEFDVEPDTRSRKLFSVFAGIYLAAPIIIFFQFLLTYNYGSPMGTDGDWAIRLFLVLLLYPITAPIISIFLAYRRYYRLAIIISIVYFAMEPFSLLYGVSFGHARLESITNYGQFYDTFFVMSTLWIEQLIPIPHKIHLIFVTIFAAIIQTSYVLILRKYYTDLRSDINAKWVIGWVICTFMFTFSSLIPIITRWGISGWIITPAVILAIVWVWSQRSHSVENIPESIK